MNGLIRASLNNYHAVTVFVLTVVVVGLIAAAAIPVDILPPFKSPAVQVLTFYGGMPARSVENDITNRMERWTGQAAGTLRQESRSIVGCSIVRNFYRDDIDPNGALTQVNSLASAAIPNLPPGTLPPVILPFDPTRTTPLCLVALDRYNVFLPTGDAKFGNIDYALDSNSLYELPELMGDIPLQTRRGRPPVFLGDVASPRDA